MPGQIGILPAFGKRTTPDACSNQKDEAGRRKAWE